MVTRGHPDLTAIRQLFPITKRYAYFENGSNGPLSLRVRAAVEEYLADVQYNGAVNLAAWYKRREEVRGLAARLVGAEPAEIAFPRNTSQGLLFVSNGIPWRDGDNIVTAETENVANVHPWLSLKRLGVETRFAPSHDERIAVDDIVDLIDERTRLVALSFVEADTGFRNNLAAIGEVCRKRGVYLCVDAAQGLGALRLDVKESHIDFMSTNCHKWLLSPLGIGIFYCRKELIEELIPALVGWRSRVGGGYDAPLSPNADRFDEGTPNRCGLYGLGESLTTIFELGPDWIEERIRALTDHLIEGLQGRGYKILSPIASWEERSGNVTFDHDKYDSADLNKRLIEANVIVSHTSKSFWPDPINRPGLRVGPHFYNTEEEIDRLLEALP